MATYPAVQATQTEADGTRPSPSRAAAAATQTQTAAARPAPTRTGAATVQSEADAARPRPVRTADGVLVTTSSGVVVPGDFRGVEVTVVTPDGERLTEVNQLLALDPFAVSTPIDKDGRGTLSLLQTTYTDFRAIAKRPGSDTVQYAWFEGMANSIGINQREAEIVVQPVEIKGLHAGGGADFGGMLG